MARSPCTAATARSRQGPAWRGVRLPAVIALAVAFSVVQWPVYAAQSISWPPNAALIGGLCALSFAGNVILLAIYRSIRRFARQADAARESAADAMRSHRVWLAEAEEKASTAIAASQFQAAFLAHIAHELRMPLNAMLGFSEIIKDEMFGPVGTPRYKSYAQSLHQSAAQLLRSANNLLDLSRVDAGRLQIVDRAINLPAFLTQLEQSLSPALEPKQLTLALEIGDGLPALSADPRLLRSMLQSLLSNAIRFSSKRGKITLRAALDDAGRITLTVADAGAGIAPKDLAQAMQPFGQATDEGNRRHRGIGIGLPLTKAMIEVHGGSFELRSVQNQGTTVILRFPAERSTSAPQPVSPAQDTLTLGTTPDAALPEPAEANDRSAEPFRNAG